MSPAGIFETSLADASQVFANLTGSAAVTNLRDYNRDGVVSLGDAGAVFANLGNLNRINIDIGGPFAPEGASVGGDAVASALSIPLAAVTADASGNSVRVAQSGPNTASIDRVFAQLADGVDPRSRVKLVTPRPMMWWGSTMSCWTSWHRAAAKASWNRGSDSRGYCPAARSEQLRQRPAFFHQVERPAFAVARHQVVDAHARGRPSGRCARRRRACRRGTRPACRWRRRPGRRGCRRRPAGPTCSAVQWSRPAPLAPPERGSPIFGLRPISLETMHQRLVQQAALVQVVEQGGERPVELGQQAVLQAVEVVAVRVPAAAALAQLVELLVAFPEDGDERHAGLDQPAGQQHRHGVDARAVLLAHALPARRAGRRRPWSARDVSSENALLLVLARSRPAARECSARRWASSSACKQLRGASSRSGETSPRQASAGHGEIERLFARAVDEQRIVLDAQPGGELAGPRVLRRPFLVRQRDGVGQAAGAAAA